MAMLSGPRGPFTCGVFLTQTEVFLEGPFGKEIFAYLARRGSSRFGQVNYWVNGVSPLDATKTANISPERVDLIIFVGLPEDLHQRINQFASRINYSTTIVVVITAAAPTNLKAIKQAIKPAVFINLQQEKFSQSSKIVDSLIALNYYYENALSQFSLFDLRYLWPPSSIIEVAWLPVATAKNLSIPTKNSSRIEPLTTGTIDLSQGNHLLILRGFDSPSPENTMRLWEKLTASLAHKGNFLWYAVGLPPSLSHQPEILLFSPGHLT